MQTLLMSLFGVGLVVIGLIVMVLFRFVVDAMTVDIDERKDMDAMPRHLKARETYHLPERPHHPPQRRRHVTASRQRNASSDSASRPR